MSPTDFAPYANQADFELADLLYRCVQMSAGTIDNLMQNWAARPESTGDSPFADHEDLYNYNQPVAPGDNTLWKMQEHVVHFHDSRKILQQQLTNPDFKSEMDFTLKQIFVNGSRQYEDFMSGNWAWRQADIIVKDPATHGSTFVPIILGSDKTTVSPLYMSSGLVHNGVQHAHRNAVALIGFLAIPKTDRENQDSNDFRTFRPYLFYASLRNILQSLKPGMTVSEVTLFADGNYHCVIYGLCPYIAEYPEHVLLACMVQGLCTAARDNLNGPGGRRTQQHTETLFDVLDHSTMWDQYGVVPDVLGTLKDHLVAWVGEYLELEHGKSKAKKIMADIDRWIAAVPPFPGLRRFPEGRGFKQWMGDDSKALMKVYLPAIEGHVPTQMLRAFSAFLDFCYLVHRNVIDETTLDAIDAALSQYHQERIIFVESGVCPDGFCLPHQHSLTHYRFLIQQFGAPNGLCSSITESKHIKAVKQPWRRSSCYEALSQMLTINDRLDKLAAACVDFNDWGMFTSFGLNPWYVVPNIHTWILCKFPQDPDALAQHFDLPELVPLLCRFLYLLDNPDRNPDIPLADIPLDDCPDAPTSVRVFPSAVAKFYVPSDTSGVHGMLCERIRAVRSWHGGAPRYDCVFVGGNPDLPGFRGMMAACVLLFMSFKHRGIVYPCTLVTWLSVIGDEPFPEVGMWMVKPDVDCHGQRVMDIIHIDTILR
ncbi:hypothetical protein C8J57DRAFT_1437043 [Mycena rebaudengoi]|nr:hypothetical protein C8J57DRAFT_1437043 [Mycena rebaudengoi]